MDAVATGGGGDPWTWARARLRLGQANVGTWVVLAAAVVASVRPVAPASWPAEAAGWVGLVALHALIQAPFDAVGGYHLPVRFRRRVPGAARWLRGWLRGVAAHAAVGVVVGLALMAAARVGGNPAAWAVGVVATVALVALQGVVARIAAPLEVDPADGALRAEARALGLPPGRVRRVRSPERGFVGGWVGLPGFEILWFPSRWAVDPDLLAVQLRRRVDALRTGRRRHGVWAAIAWNLTGWSLAVALVPPGALGSATGLLLVSAATTLWAFLGILVLPAWSREAVRALDHLAAQALDADRVGEAIRRTDRDQEDEAHREAWVGRVFHPVPTPARRVASLGGPPPAGPLWRVTRTGLFLGWAQLSWLSRAVHCNIGRSDLWVILPGD